MEMRKFLTSALILHKEKIFIAFTQFPVFWYYLSRERNNLTLEEYKYMTHSKFITNQDHPSINHI